MTECSPTFATLAARKEAHVLLDSAKNGEAIPAWKISKALQATGDLDPDESIQLVTESDQWTRKPLGLALAQWFDIIL